MFGDYIRRLYQGDFIVDPAAFSSLLDAISNGTTIISLNRLSNKIHVDGYHPVEHPCCRIGLGIRWLIILIMTNMLNQEKRW